MFSIMQATNIERTSVITNSIHINGQDENNKSTSKNEIKIEKIKHPKAKKEKKFKSGKEDKEPREKKKQMENNRQTKAQSTLAPSRWRQQFVVRVI